MKHLTTLLTMAITLTGLAQQMPYNPDANGDDFVGVDDVLGVLGVYDTALMQPDLQCDYEGTNLEQLFGGLIAGSLVLDSVYIEYSLVDSALTYLPECPDPVIIETVLERSYTLSGAYMGTVGGNPYTGCDDYHLGYYRRVEVGFSPNSGQWNFYVRDGEVEELTSFGAISQWNQGGESNCCIPFFTLPFPSSWTLDENGINVDWNTSEWVHNCQHFRVIPFWHEAE